MSKIKLKELSKLGYTNNQARTTALNVIAKYCKHHTAEAIADLLVDIKNNPTAYLQEEGLNKIALCFVEEVHEEAFAAYELNSEARQVKTYGAKNIDTIAKQQMDMALRLPIATRGALMPDAHAGYGLPIGGVLACDNAVIPYGIGVDIGCRMAMTIYDANETAFNQYKYQCKTALSEWTHFGNEGGLEQKQDHRIMQHALFNELELCKKLKGKAWRQLGSSGGGNHFVEWGLLDMQEQNNLQLRPGRYIALLSHSGSRGLGATIAQHYFAQAMAVCKLPNIAKHMAWLNLDSSLGQEYWLAMNLAGEYAAANHEVIHANITKALGFTPIACVQNHHNFAWQEEVDGKQLIVHRKGATPAHKGEFGIIPGSMAHAGYLVSGKGNALALNSASHGAGRAMSRAKAKSTNTVSAMKKMLADNNITLIGGSTEEAPNAYKDIAQVMLAQQELVHIEGKFQPKIVRMYKE
jgi:tRNA-splicing ligase RtcB (3'-phosphate/5'-hydroxy nucleic acid ligase)